MFWGGAEMVQGQGRMTEATTRDLRPKLKKGEGKVSRELQLGSSTLLPQKRPLNSHFSHTILQRRFPLQQ